ncbi:hypothetical protein [Pseudomonas poae]|uniref:PAAR domain-containing protein n=1 Tax=Pseudomonas poae TaxID=200451 RepID=A0ABY0RK04_9PSED|nr:hypothetical protein [Pseudomonas poae]SDO20384.1 hypothetical protein SAMN04490208_2934 [Pseudomonas poae]
MSLLSGLLDHLPPAIAGVDSPKVDSQPRPRLVLANPVERTPRLIMSPHASAATATPEWRQARDQYLNHIMVCRSCYAYQSEVPDGATLAVSRDNGFWASGGCLATVLIDGKKVARIDTGEIVKFKVKPGRHIVGIAGDEEGNGLCAMQIGQPVKETAAEVSSGETQKFRISGTQNGTDIRPSSI